MIDRNLDRAFIELNRRIKMKQSSDSVGWLNRIVRGIHLLAEGEWGAFLKKCSDGSHDDGARLYFNGMYRC